MRSSLPFQGFEGFGREREKPLFSSRDPYFFPPPKSKDWRKVLTAQYQGSRRERAFEALQKGATSAMTEARSFRAEGLCVLYIALNASLNLLNRWALGVSGFAFPLTLTGLHRLASGRA